MKIRTYTELIKLPTFVERFNYLRLVGEVGAETFGNERYLNQLFYKDSEWRRIRREVILRDNGCDLGVEGYEIQNRILIHHLNPISEKDILNRTEFLLSPEYLITTCFDTHNAIHYGTKRPYLEQKVPERSPNDTCPWRQ